MFMLQIFAKWVSLNKKSVRIGCFAFAFALAVFWFICVLSCGYLRFEPSPHQMDYPSRLVQADPSDKKVPQQIVRYCPGGNEQEVAPDIKDLDPDKSRASFLICISNISQQACYLIIIWLWMYAARKYYREARKQKGYMEDILGRSYVTDKIWSRHMRLSHAWTVCCPMDPYDEDDQVEEEEDEDHDAIMLGKKSMKENKPVTREKGKRRDRKKSLINHLKNMKIKEKELLESIRTLEERLSEEKSEKKPEEKLQEELIKAQNELMECREELIKYPKDTWESMVVKVLYAVGWFGILLFCDYSAIKLGYVPILRDARFPFDLAKEYGLVYILCWLTVVLILATQFMSYHSWWLCMEYAFFIRNISKKIISADKSIYEIEKEFKGNFLRNSPSETPSFRRLMHDSEMTSVAFLIVSSMFALSCLIPYGIMGTDIVQTGMYDVKWRSVFVTCTAFALGLVSLIPVSIMPKLFLYRILRKWKRISIKEIEAKIKLLDDKYVLREYKDRASIWKYERDRVYWEEQIYKISKNRFSLNVIGVMANVVTCIFIFTLFMYL